MNPPMPLSTPATSSLIQIPNPGSSAPYQFASSSSTTMTGKKIEYEFYINQQPHQARMVGSGDKSDRRPLDPPPAARFRIIDQSQPDSSCDLTLLRSPFYICMATLCQADPPHAEYFTMPHSRKPYMVGSRVSSTFQVKPGSPSDPAGHFFVFPDLGVRTEGIFRLKLSVYEILEDKARFCASSLTHPFEVFTAKRFPGMKASTLLSKSFANQGIRLRIRSKPANTHNQLNQASAIAPTESYENSSNMSRPPKKRQKRATAKSPSDLITPLIVPTPYHQKNERSTSDARLPSLPSLSEMLKGAPAQPHQPLPSFIAPGPSLSSRPS